MKNKIIILGDIKTNQLTKRFIAMVFFMLIILLPMSAQRFKGGPFIGLTASQVDGDSHAGFNKLGILGGVFVNTAFKNNIGAQFEIRYAGRGAQKGTSLNDTRVYKLSLHYIDLPLMATYTFKKNVILELGIVPGYLFAKNGKDSGGPLPEEFLVEFKKFDLGWLAGLNYKITENLIAGIRYSYSFFSINDHDNLDVNYSVIGRLFGYSKGDYNNYLAMGVYYQFIR